MQLAPRLNDAIQQQVFSYDEALKVHWAMEMYDTAPVGTEIDYSPAMRNLLKRLYCWLDNPEAVRGTRA